MNIRPVVFATAIVLLCGVTAFAGTPVSHVSGNGNTTSASTHPFGTVAADPLVYAQNPNYNGAYSSQNDTNGFGNFATAYDNFTLNSTTNLTAVAWIGSYFNPPQQGNITAFTLNFYADAAGQPGALLASYNGPGNFGETFLGNDNVGDPTFLYSGNLGSAFVATAGTTYWMSLVPDLGFPPQWGWETSSDGDGIAYQDFFGTRSQLPSDLSFALYGNTGATPEPGTLVMLGTGVLGLAGTLRRKLF